MLSRAFGRYPEPNAPWSKQTFKLFRKAPPPASYHVPPKVPGRSRFTAYSLAIGALIGIGGLVAGIVALHVEVEPVQQTEMRQASEALVNTWETAREMGEGEATQAGDESVNPND